jgi:hypothetical protein
MRSPLSPLARTTPDASRKRALPTSLTPPPMAKLQHDLVALQLRIASKKRAEFLKQRGLDPVAAGVTSAMVETLQGPTAMQRQFLTTAQCLELIRRVDAGEGAPAVNLGASLPPEAAQKPPTDEPVPQTAAPAPPPQTSAQLTEGRYSLDLRGVDLSVADFLVVAHAFSGARHIVRVDFSGAAFSTAHLLILAEAIERRNAPLASVELDEELRRSAPRHVARIDAAIRQLAQRAQQQQKAARPVRRGTIPGSPADAAASEADYRTARVDHFARERDGRKRLQAAQRREMALIRGTCRRIADAVATLDKQAAHQARLQVLLRPCGDAEVTARGAVYRQEWAQRVAVLEAQLADQCSSAAATEVKERRALWAAYSISYELSKRAKANRIHRHRLERLRVMHEALEQHALTVNERWVEFKDMHGDHLARFDLLRRQQQSAWQTGGDVSSDEESTTSGRASSRIMSARGSMHAPAARAAATASEAG